jgi:hypothetical protein
MAPIPGYNFPAAVFLLELSLQCNLAKDAFQRLEEGTQGWQEGEWSPHNRATPLELVSRSIVFLSAAAMISKILFGARNKPKVEERASGLRQLLEVDSETLPLLSSRGTRNNLEHLDERLDAYFEGFTKGAFSYGIHIQETDPKEGMFVPRRIHPRSLIFTAAGESIDLRSCMNEIEVLEEKIYGAYSKLKEDPYPLWSA